jgi:pimeloyl-ACP methyl ester carboxylesterase
MQSIALAALAALILSGCAGPKKLSRVRTSDGFTIAFDLAVPPESGSGKAPLVVLCHQNERDRTSWEPMMPVLLDHGYAALRLDHRSFGESRREASSHLDLSDNEKASIHEDILAVIRAASKHPRVDSDRVAVIASGFSTTYAARAASKDSRIQALVLLGGFLEGPDEDFLVSHPELPVFLVIAEGDLPGLEVMRQHRDHLRGPNQELIEIAPVDPSDSTSWRGTDGFAAGVGLADLIVWKLEQIFPVQKS